MPLVCGDYSHGHINLNLLQMNIKPDITRCIKPELSQFELSRAINNLTDRKQTTFNNLFICH